MKVWTSLSRSALCRRRFCPVSFACAAFITTPICLSEVAPGLGHGGGNGGVDFFLAGARGQIAFDQRASRPLLSRPARRGRALRNISAASMRCLISDLQNLPSRPLRRAAWANRPSAS